MSQPPRPRSGRHRGTPDEAPRRVRTNPRTTGGPGRTGTKGPAERTDPAGRAQATALRRTRALRHKIAVSSAAFTLVSSFVIALPANADGPAPLELAPSFSPTAAQTLHVRDHLENTAVDPGGYTVQPLPGGSEVVSVAPAGLSNADWAGVVLQDGGWPTSANNLAVMTEWMNAENPPRDWWNRNNPLNNGYGSGGGAGLGSYGDLLTAATKVAQNLQRGSAYAQIVADLAASAPPQTTASAIWASPWAGSHYEYGSHWVFGPIPVVAAPASAW